MHNSYKKYQIKLNYIMCTGYKMKHIFFLFSKTDGLRGIVIWSIFMHFCEDYRSLQFMQSLLYGSSCINLSNAWLDLQINLKYTTETSCNHFVFIFKNSLQYFFLTISLRVNSICARFVHAWRFHSFEGSLWTTRFHNMFVLFCELSRVCECGTLPFCLQFS